MAALREEMRAQPHPARDPSPNPQLPGQSMVAKALYDIPRLNEKEFDVWLSFVSDAMLGAGMGALFRASAFPNDNGVDAVHLVEISTYPTWLTNGAWTALRRSVGADATAYARSMAIKPGDVLALLRSLRAFYERRAVPLLTQLRKDLIRINISDYPDFKHYTSALELIFTKLAALGDNVSDNVRRFHLLEGLSDEYHAIVSSVVAYEGPSGRHADFAKAVELISMYEDNFNSKRRKVNQDTTMFAKSPATSTRGSQRDASKRNRGGGDARPDSGTLEPCVFF